MRFICNCRTSLGMAIAQTFSWTVTHFLEVQTNGNTIMAKSKASTAGRAKVKTATAKPAKRAAKRELINTGTDKRYVRRDSRGKFHESDDVGRSLAADRR